MQSALTSQKREELITLHWKASPGKVGQVVQGQSMKSVADLRAKPVPIISQPRALATELCFLPLEVSGFLPSFLSLHFLLSVLFFIT